MDACESIDCLSSCIIDFYIEHTTFYHRTFTLCGGCYNMCMYIPDRVTITDSDGMGPCTRVYAVSCAWASVGVPHHHQVMSAPAPKAAVLAMLIRRMEAPKWYGWTPEFLLGRGK
jgi:hypothetical protein